MDFNVVKTVSNYFNKAVNESSHLNNIISRYHLDTVSDIDLYAVNPA